MPVSSKPKKSKEELALQKKHELTLKVFRMIYEDYQQGKMHLIF